MVGTKRMARRTPKERLVRRLCHTSAYRTFFGIGLAAWTTTLAGVVHASGDDVVNLKDGGLVRGTVVLLEKGKKVVVELVDGTTKTVAWDDVAKVRLGEAADGPDGEGADEPPDDGEKPSPVVEEKPPEKGAIPDHVRPAEKTGHEPARKDEADGDDSKEMVVHIEGESSASLMRRRKGDDTDICAAPCGKTLTVSPTDRFYIDGEGMMSSSQFDLYSSGVETKAVVDAGSSALFYIGIVVASVGYAGAIGAGIYTLAEQRGLTYWPPEPEPFGTAIGAGAGLLIGVTGTLMALGGRTEITLIEGEAGDVGAGAGGVTWRF